MKQSAKPVLSAFLTLFCITNLLSQDTIVKINGEIIPAKITEVGTNAVTYKKWAILDGPHFIDYKSDIVYIKYFNGQKDVFKKDQNTPQKPMLDTVRINKNISQPSEALNSRSKNKIEFMNNKYTINGQKAGRRDVDRLLSKSKNPAVQISHKTAKATKIAQKIIGLTSIASTTTGGIMSVSTIYTCIKESSNGGNTSIGSYVNMGVSLLGTVSLPITSKILKNRRDKLYDKTIDLYNVTN